MLEEHGVEMIGADREVIHRPRIARRSRRRSTRSACRAPESDRRHARGGAGVPRRDRTAGDHPPAFTLGGTGGGIAYNREEFEEIVGAGSTQSPIDQVLIDESLLGWKEYELEVVRDRNDNCVIVCGIENIDPMGVHTGDSITVAPIQTLTDSEYQRMRDAAFAIMRAIGVDTGGSNVQFAVNPANGDDGRDRDEPAGVAQSALASKATGFPIAKIAAKLAVGYTLDEIRNDITGTTRRASSRRSTTS